MDDEKNKKLLEEANEEFKIKRDEEVKAEMKRWMLKISGLENNLIAAKTDFKEWVNNGCIIVMTDGNTGCEYTVCNSTNDYVTSTGGHMYTASTTSSGGI